jgi:alkylresorcinol/alkylpyrone synthase
MPPHLHSLATAVPANILDRATIAEFACRIFGAEGARMAAVFDNSGIDRRYSCLNLDWCLHPHGWAERSRLFVTHAVDLSCRATLACLKQAGLTPDAVDAIVAVSTSGVCTPNLDALVAERLALRPDVLRLPIFGLGCAGGVLGLGRAAALAQATPGSKVLLVVVELCTLTFRPNDPSKSNIIATALFGDGAAAALISTTGSGPAVTAWGEHRWPGTLDVMGWTIEDDGFGVLFSRDIPTLVRHHFRPALDAWLRRVGGPIGGYLCHPGGAKVIVALEESLDLPPGTLADERAVLAEYGNMSAATVMFVLDRALRRPLIGRHVATALGPGFCAGFAMLEG